MTFEQRALQRLKVSFPDLDPTCIKYEVEVDPFPNVKGVWRIRKVVRYGLFSWEDVIYENRSWRGSEKDFIAPGHEREIIEILA